MSILMALDPILNLEWDGSDGPGVGIRNYTIYYQENGGPFEQWLVDTLVGSGEFVAELGSNYCFYSVANDKVGNFESEPPIPDTCFTVDLCAFPSVLVIDLTDRNGDHAAIESIIATGVTNPIDSIDLYSGSDINLNQGIEIQKGTQFTANIEDIDCSQNSVFFPSSKLINESDKKAREMPKEINIQYEYNPLNGLLFVRYALPYGQKISLNIRDNNSKVVNKIFDKTWKQMGYHELVLPIDKRENPNTYLVLNAMDGKVKKEVKISLVK